MKNRNIFVLVFLVFSNFLYAQGTTCNSSDPFCTGTVSTFPAGVNVQSAFWTAPGNNYGCLGTSPNPAWYYLEIDQPGNLLINITNNLGSSQDIDFAIWGPFSNLTTAMNNCGSLGQPHDCSYSPAAYPEQVSIIGASTGDVFILLITNFSNTSCNVSFTNVGGTATTDCSIINPCSINSISATPSSCVGNTTLLMFLSDKFHKSTQQVN